MIYAKHATHCLAQSEPAAFLVSVLGALSKVVLEFALIVPVISRTVPYKGRPRWAVPENTVSNGSIYRDAAAQE